MSDLDVVAVMGVMLSFGIILLFGDLLLFKFQAGNALCGADATCQQVMTAGPQVIGTFSNMFIFLYFGAILGSLFLASLTPSSPMFYIITLLTSICVFITAPIISNLYFGALNTGQFDDIAANHSAEVWFFQNLPILTIFSHFLVGFVLHGKPQSSGGGGVPQAFR